MSEYQEFTGRTVEEAIRVAREALGVADLADLDFEILTPGSRGVLGMPGNWPEPFGLVAIESLACGTPVLTRRVGALPEIVREGVDGWFGDDPQQLAFRVPDVAALDRAAIRSSVLERFSASRMVRGRSGDR